MFQCHVIGTQGMPAFAKLQQETELLGEITVNAMQHALGENMG